MTSRCGSLTCGPVDRLSAVSGWPGIRQYECRTSCLLLLLMVIEEDVHAFREGCLMLLYDGVGPARGS